MKKLTNLLLLGGLLLLGAQSAWADEQGLFGNEAGSMGYIKNGGTELFITMNSTDDIEGVTSLGEVSSLSITKWYVNVWKNSSGNITAAYFAYKIGSWDGSKYVYSGETYATHTAVSETDKNGGGKNQCWKNESFDKSLVSSSSASGKFSFMFWLQAKNGASNTYWCTNNGKNYQLQYSVLPPAVSSFSVAATGDVIGGDGTEGNPYIIKNGGSLTLTASGSQEHTDANSALNVQFGSESVLTSGFAKTISSITSTEAASIIVKGYYNNSTAELNGAESSKPIYYKAGETYEMSVATYATLFLTYPVEIPSGITAYYESDFALGANGTQVTASFTSISGGVIPANTPVILRSASSSNYTFKQVADVSGLSLAGHFLGVSAVTAKSSLSNVIYVLANGANGIGFYQLNDGQSIAANRCYYWTDSEATAPTIRFELEDENEATALQSVEAGEQQFTKFIQDGKVFIIRDGVKYDVTGRVVR